MGEDVIINIVQELRLNGPPEEVEFSDGGQEGLIAWNLEEDSLTATVRVKILLGVCLELGLVADIDEELLTVEWITDEIAAAVIRDKPVN